MILGIALAALIGLSLGLLGGGGSILTVPILVYVLGFGAKEAIAMSLAVVVQRAFARFLVVMGSFILYQNRAVLLPGPAADANAATVTTH